MVTQHIDKLLARYFAGEMSSLDEIELDYWLSESKENEQYFLELTSLYQHLGGTNYPEFENTNAFDKYKKHISGNQYVKLERKYESEEAQPKKYKLWILTATAIAVALIGIIFLWGGEDDVRSISKQGVYTLGNQVEASLEMGKILMRTNTDTIYMQGRVEFKMKSEDAGSSIVKVGKLLVRDIGTQFIVDATSSDSVYVSVSDGEVQFYSAYEEGIYLRANESGYFLSSTNQFYKIVPKRSFQFVEAKMEDVVSQLSSAYGISIKIDRDVRTLAISVAFHDEALETVLDILSIALDVEVNYDNNQYMITKK